MKRPALLLSSLLVMATFLACSEDASESGSPPPSTTPGTAPTEPGPAPEAPLAPRAICPTIVAKNIGSSCSGASTGAASFCVAHGTCEDAVCALDSRAKTSFAVYCTAHCTVGGADRCPLGYECVEQSGTCAGGVDSPGAMCAQKANAGCTEVPGFSGSLGAVATTESGAVFSFVNGYDGKETKLSLITDARVSVVASWASATQDALRRADDLGDGGVLVVTDNYDVVVKDKKGNPTKHASLSGAAIGRGEDGSFISLGTAQQFGYHALSKRGEDGKWTEIGPTRQRSRDLVALRTGFLARCGDEGDLCVSKDGENFTPVALPQGLAMPLTVPFQAVGASTSDFYLTAANGLYHHRKGEWVKEAPVSVPNTSSYQRDVLREFADGTVVFHAWNGTDFTTYVSGSDCWSSSSSQLLVDQRLGKGAFLGESMRNTSICRTPVR